MQNHLLFLITTLLRTKGLLFKESFFMRDIFIVCVKTMIRIILVRRKNNASYRGQHLFHNIFATLID